LRLFLRVLNEVSVKLNIMSEILVERLIEDLVKDLMEDLVKNLIEDPIKNLIQTVVTYLRESRIFDVGRIKSYN